MKVLVTGSAGHLGEALVRTLRAEGHEVIALDILASPSTTHNGSITDRATLKACMRGVGTVFHAATLHKPHVATHSRVDFIDTNVTGTLNLLEEAVAAGVGTFVFTSTTSAFGDALAPPAGAPAAWITEDVAPVPKNIYGVTKVAAEDLCQLFHRNHGLACIVLRTSRFFPEEDDSRSVRDAYSDDNAKLNEFLHRRVDIEDVVSAHLLAAERGGPSASGNTSSARRPPSFPRTSKTCAATRGRSCAVASLTSRRSTGGAAGGCFRRSTASTSTSGRGPTGLAAALRLPVPSQTLEHGRRTP